MAKYDSVSLRPKDFGPLAHQCIGCDSEKLLASDERSGLRYSCCGSCGLVFMNPMLTKSFYDSFYSGVYWDLTGRNVEARLRKQVGRALVLSNVMRRLRVGLAGKKLLDVGAGFGGVSFALGRIWGLEPSTFEPDRQSSKISLNLGNFNLREADPGAFDLLVMMHVLEHQPNPIQFLTSYLELLAEDGILCIEVPNGLESMDGGIDHPLIFTPSSLESTLAQFGYESSMVLHRGHGTIFGPRKYLLCIARRSSLSRMSTSRAELSAGYSSWPKSAPWLLNKIGSFLALVFLRRSLMLKDQLTSEALDLALRAGSKH